MRKITTFIAIFSSLKLVTGLEYEPCDLMSEFIVKYKLPLEDSIGMTCVANSVSELKTTHAQTDSLTNSRVFGMFGISEGGACKFGSPGFCHVTCDKFLDNDITDDLECVQKILERTSKRPKVFTDCETYDWKNFMEDCSKVIKKLGKREAQKSKFFKLKDFEVVQKESLDETEDELEKDTPKTTIVRPGPPANPRPVDYDQEEEEDLPNKSNFRPDYVTDEPPRPFSNRKKSPRKSSSSKRASNGKGVSGVKSRKKKQSKPSGRSRNPMSAVIKTPILPMEFHVIPGPSVSVPISSLNQPIPDVPIDPPPSLTRIPSFNTGSREYLPPFAAQTDPDGRSKKYDIKLDRPVSQITVHVTYA